MATSASLTLREAIIPLQPSFLSENIRTTKVENRWTTGGANPREHYYKMYLPICDDPSQKELFLYVIDQFFDAAHNDRLHLSTGTERYTKFRQVVDGALRMSWVAISDAQNNKTVDNFAGDVRTLVGEYLTPSSYEDQLNYLRSVEKPYSMECENLGARLKVISRLGRLLPGAPTVNDVPQPLYQDDAALKRAYFNMMRGDWKIKFVSSAHDLEDANFTYQRLVRFMATQEAISKQGIKRNRQGAPLGGRGGRYGRGNDRGGGRGAGGYYSNYGRGRGRGNYGNYQYNRGGQGSYGNNPSGYGGRHYGQSYSPGPAPGYAQGYRTPVQGTSTPRPYRGGGNSRGRGTPGRSNYGRGAGRGYAAYSPGGRQVRYPGVAPGRGPPPIPNFMADQFYQEEPVQQGDHYYQEEQGPPEDHYYQEEPNEQGHGYDDQYFQEGHDDSFVADSHDSYPSEQEQPQDAHFLQDFGY